MSKKKIFISDKEINPENLPFFPYVKKPVQIYAIQIPEPFEVETLEGTMTGNPHDWLIKGVEGEYYPCKDSVFKKTYMPVEKIKEEKNDRKR